MGEDAVGEMGTYTSSQDLQITKREYDGVQQISAF